MSIKKAIRCGDPNCNHGEGSLLLSFDGDRMYVRCRNRDCRKITRITFRIPGINLDFNNAGIVQETLPEDFHQDIERATTVVAE